TLPYCFGVGGDAAIGNCVACLNNSQCKIAPKLVCANDSHACVECTQSDKSACHADGQGAACLMPSDTCGCVTDSDCGGAMSGRVCDAITHRCEVGCNTTAGGNTCPTCNTCSVIQGSTLGRCMPVPGGCI